MTSENHAADVASGGRKLNRIIIIIGGVALLILISIVVIILIFNKPSCLGGNWNACIVRHYQKNIPASWYSMTDPQINADRKTIILAALEACAECNPLPIVFPVWMEFVDPKMMTESGYTSFITAVSKNKVSLYLDDEIKFDSFGEYEYYFLAEYVPNIVY